jgi:hypothetical protein
VAEAFRSGDVPIDINEQCFTLPDAAFLARVPDMSIRNWQSRKILNMGRKEWPSGRWYFSILDMLRIDVMFDLCVRRGMDFGPTKAGVIAAVVVNAATDNLSQPRKSYRPNLNVVIAWEADGEMFATTADIKHAGHYYPPVSDKDGEEYSPLCRTVICIPAAKMLSDLVIRTEALQHHNQRAEGPTHV